MRYDVGGRAQVLRGRNTPDETRVILIKPGDALLIGNLGELTPEIFEAATKALKAMGFDRVTLFSNDIEIGRVAEAQPTMDLINRFGPKIEEAR